MDAHVILHLESKNSAVRNVRRHAVRSIRWQVRLPQLDVELRPHVEVPSRDTRSTPAPPNAKIRWNRLNRYYAREELSA